MLTQYRTSCCCEINNSIHELIIHLKAPPRLVPAALNKKTEIVK